MQSKRGITIAILDNNSLLVGVPGDVTPDKARLLQVVVKDSFPEWKPLVIGNGSIVDLRSSVSPELAAEATSLVERLQVILESRPDLAEVGELRSIK